MLSEDDIVSHIAPKDFSCYVSYNKPKISRQTLPAEFLSSFDPTQLSYLEISFGVKPVNTYFIWFSDLGAQGKIDAFA